MNTSRGIGIAPEEQEAIVAGLSRVLADSYTLYLKTHNYHWNVVGPMFHSLHAMFMEEYTELSLAVDEWLNGSGHWERRRRVATVSSQSWRP